MSMEQTKPEKNKVNYSLNPRIKFSIEDSMFRYHFTDAIIPPQVNKNDTLLRLGKENRIRFILEGCLNYRKMQELTIKRGSGITRSQPVRKSWQKKNDFLSKTAKLFSNKYIIKEPKTQSVVPVQKKPKPAPVPPLDMRHDEMAWVGIELHDEQGYAIKNERFELYKGDKKISSGTTDKYGMARVIYLNPGNYDVCFPNMDKKKWRIKGG